MKNYSLHIIVSILQIIWVIQTQGNEDKYWRQLVKTIFVEDAIQTYRVLKVHLISINIPQHCINDDDFHILSTHQMVFATKFGVLEPNVLRCTLLDIGIRNF